MKWFFVSILLIYAFATPGEYLPLLPLEYSPTYEGLQSGLSQIARLLIALALLSLLFSGSHKEDLMYGLYLLLMPLKMLGLNTERFVARLILTLNYVEALAVNKVPQNFHQLGDMHLLLESQPDIDSEIVLKRVAFNRLDKALIVLVIIGVIIAGVMLL